MRLLFAIAAMIAVLLAAPAVAQFQSMGDKGKQEQPKKKPEDDRGYKSAIERLPDQKFDPWRNIR